MYQGRPPAYDAVWDVIKDAVGVEVNKQVGGRIIRKRRYIRYEHVQHSRCREDYLARTPPHRDIEAGDRKERQEESTREEEGRRERGFYFGKRQDGNLDADSVRYRQRRVQL